MEQSRHFMILFRTFLKIGAFTLGGGYAMLPLMEREFVSRRKWITEEEMVDIIAVVQSLPGIIAVKASLFIGWKVAGITGALTAVIGLLIPSISMITLFAYLYVSIQDNPLVQSLFIGVRSGVTALILLAGIKLGKKVLTDWLSVLLAAVSLAAVWLLDIHAGLVIIAAAFIGYTLFGVFRLNIKSFGKRKTGKEQSIHGKEDES